MKSMKKVVFGCLGATAIIAVALAVGVWFLLFRELPVLDASLSIAPEVEIGSTVTMVISATNTHKKPVTLDSVDIDNAFLAGFQVVGVDPKPEGTTRVPIVNQRSWGFGKRVSPGKVFSVTFTLKAVADGHFSGDVDVCNPNQDFKTLLADVVVTKKETDRPNERP
jgi:hypothetical protein